ncbi:MAG: hypothetical protein JO306_10315 [Gemmatimonadetes bacterium]|nr:hypothetical protein [Gemmatimonadota bacterium]
MPNDFPAIHFAKPVHVAPPSATAHQALGAAKAKNAAAVLVREHGRAAGLIPLERLEDAESGEHLRDIASVKFARLPPETPTSELLGARVPWALLGAADEAPHVVAVEWLDLPGQPPRTRGPSIGIELPDLGFGDHTVSYRVPDVFGPIRVKPPKVIYRCPVDGTVYDFEESRQHLEGGEVVCEHDDAVMVPERKP